MPRRRNSVPKYRLHKQSGQAIVTVRTSAGGRRDVLLGPHNSDESRAEYARLLAELAAGRPPEPVSSAPGKPIATPTVTELLLAYFKHATNYYRDPETGGPTKYMDTVKAVVKAARELFAGLTVAEFRPAHLKMLQAKFVAAGNCRKEVNRRVGLAKRVFKG